MTIEHYITLDAENLVIGAATSNLIPSGCVPVDIKTYQAACGVIGFAKWENGKLITVAPIVRAPYFVSRRQFRLQLEAEQLLDKAEMWIKTQDRATQIAYEDSDGFNRNELKLQEAFKALGYSPDKIDGFFVKASQI